MKELYQRSDCFQIALRLVLQFAKNNELKLPGFYVSRWQDVLDGLIDPSNLVTVGNMKVICQYFKKESTLQSITKSYSCNIRKNIAPLQSRYISRYSPNSKR